MTVIVDDLLLRDLMAGADDQLIEAIAGDDVATTNLWYVRLCKSAARATEGALLRGWTFDQRRLLIAGLMALPSHIAVVPMRDLAWKMSLLAADHSGLSTLGAEAVAAAVDLNARLLVSQRDDGPGIRECCSRLAVRYDALLR